MVARASIVSVLTADFGLVGLGFTSDDFWGSNSVDSPDRDRMFIVVRAEETMKAFETTGNHVVQIWIHRPREMGNDFTELDLAATRVVEALVAAEHVVGGDGFTLTSASWQGSSEDMFDSSLNTNCRWVRFRMACRKTASA